MTSVFIEKSIEIHKNNYDYSRTRYINASTKIKIICKIHGEFEQIPVSHLRGHGCKKCSYEEKKNTVDYFIQKSNEVHKNYYNYSMVKYINNRTKITIICPEHGNFEQIPNSHILGNGCRKCSSDKYRLKMSYGNDKFKYLSKTKFPNIYDYSKIDYKNTETSIILLCIKHNLEFEIIPQNHLRQKYGGCKNCTYDGLSDTRKKTYNQFIFECNKIHENKYDYSKVSYNHCHEKIKIICRNHGEFIQQANSHLCGSGCPKCHIHKNENECKNIIEKLTGENFTRERPQFLNKLEYDCYNYELSLALEYNGIQHYEYSPFFHSNNKKKFEKQKENDKIKKELSHNNKIYLIVVPYYIADKEKFINEQYENYLFLTSNFKF
jgi:hypothetical protein